MIDFYEIIDDLEHLKKLSTDPEVHHTLQLMIENLYYRERAFQ